MPEIIANLTTQLPLPGYPPIKYTLWHLRNAVYRMGDSLELGNMLICDAGDGLTIVDAKLDACFPTLYQFIHDYFHKPVIRLINSHCHPDHAGGNHGLCVQDRPQIIAHTNCAKRLALEQQLAVLGEHFPALHQDARPDTLVDDMLTLNLDVENITLQVMTGHTDNDLTIFYHKANVVHTGDLCSFYGFPYIGLNEGGNIYNMIASLWRLIEEIDNEAIIVPGHGEHGDKRVLNRYVKMLETATNNVKALVVKGVKQEDIIKARPASDLAATCRAGVGPLNEATFTIVLHRALTATL